MITLRATVEADSGSNEEDLLLAGTEGTGVITCAGAVIGAGTDTHKWQITFHRLRARLTPLGEADGIAAYNIEYTVLEHSTNGVLTIEAITEQDTILTAA